MFLTCNHFAVIYKNKAESLFTSLPPFIIIEDLRIYRVFFTHSQGENIYIPAYLHIASMGKLYTLAVKYSPYTCYSKHRENIDTRAIFPLVSRYTGALPPNTPSHNILQNDYLTNSATKTKSLTSNFVISSP